MCYLNNSAIGSTDSRPDGDNADKPLDELKCIFERLGLGPPNARPECGILLTPPCRIADGSSYIFGYGNLFVWFDNEKNYFSLKMISK